MVQLTVQGRDCRADVAEVPDDCPVLIGQVPLELLDFVVDPAGQRLIGNPEHGGEHMIDLFCWPFHRRMYELPRLAGTARPVKRRASI